MARKPQPGADEGVWGQILNDFLEVSHDADGKLKNGSVHASTLDASSPSNGQVLSYDGTGLAWSTVTSTGSIQDASASTKGLIQLSGDLGGTAASPTVPGLAAKADTSALNTHVSATDNPHEVTKAQVGLANVDNTSDANKPISTATQTALNAKASTAALNAKADATALTAHADDTTNPHEVTKAQVGLGNVDNTSDLSKPISTATQTALNAKASTAALDAKANLSALTAHTDDTTNPHEVTKAQVGLGNVDNTSDAAKPISTATQTALNAKIGTNWGLRPVIYATGVSTWPTGRPVPSGYSGPVTWDSLAYPGHPDPTAMQAGDDWLRRIS